MIVKLKDAPPGAQIGVRDKEISNNWEIEGQAFLRLHDGEFQQGQLASMVDGVVYYMPPDTLVEILTQK